MFNAKYGLWAAILFLTEVFIAIFIKDGFVRPFVGDILVVILIYCFLRSFWKIPANGTNLGVFVFACVVEGLQYFNLIGKLGLQENKLLVVILGSSFDWKDILAYGVGCAIVFGLENRSTRFPKPRK